MRHVGFGTVTGDPLTNTLKYNIFCAFPIINMANTRNSEVEFHNFEEEACNMKFALISVLLVARLLIYELCWSAYRREVI